MPIRLIRRAIAKAREHRITPAAIDAFRARDVVRLHRALRLRPWQPSPLPLAVTALGVDPDADVPWPLDGRRLALALQAELLGATRA